MKKANPRTQKILEAARGLFIKHGTKRVTIEEICKTADVSKMTFYKYFKNKQEISLAVLEEIFNEGFAGFKEIMDKPISFREKVEQTLQMKIRMNRQWGTEFLNDFLGGDETLQSFIQQQRQESMQQAIWLLEQGKKEGVIREDLNPDFYMYTMGHIQTMLEDERLKAIFPDSRQRGEELVKFWFYGMFDAIG